jgi:hypothetical protein
MYLQDSKFYSQHQIPPFCSPDLGDGAPRYFLFPTGDLLLPFLSWDAVFVKDEFTFEFEIDYGVKGGENLGVLSREKLLSFFLPAVKSTRR